MRHANQLPILVDLIQEFRSKEFRESEDYIIQSLEREQPVALGCSALPEGPRGAIDIIHSFYTSLGALVLRGMADEALVISLFGYRADRVWKHLEPYIRREREIRDDDGFGTFFEDLVYRKRENWPPDVAYKLRTRSLPLESSGS